MILTRINGPICLCLLSFFLVMASSIVNSDRVSDHDEGELWKNLLDGDSLIGFGEPITKISRHANFTGRLINSPIAQDPKVDTTVTNRVGWFLGIPYAKPPVGDLRFKSPQHMVTSSIANTSNEYVSFKPSCQQDLSYTFTMDMDEDCLYLNVYSPESSNSTHGPYPVMVFIHGGSYRVGGGKLYPGALLARQGVVVVTFNYRLGVLGFLYGSEHIKGNYGLEDQVMALQWVQNNIKSFGGDPNKVTLFGNSAGASSVGLLNLSPLTTGLFRTVIIQSGSPNAYWAADRENSTKVYKEFVKLCGCNEVKDTLKCLQEVDVNDIIFNEYELKAEDSPTRTPFSPCSGDGGLMPPIMTLKEQQRQQDQEGAVLGTCRMKSEPWPIQANHSTADTVIIGYLDEEWSRMVGWFFEETPIYNTNLVDGFSEDQFKKILSSVITNRFSYHPFIVNLVRKEYAPGDFIEKADDMQRLIKYVNLMTDRNFIWPIVKHIESMMTLNDRNKNSGKRKHVKLFAYGMHLKDEQYMGSYHTLELGYIFGSPFLGIDVDDGNPVEYSKKDEILSSRMMTKWANIAKHSSPDEFSDWREIKGSSSVGSYVRINQTGHMTTMTGNFRSNKKMLFWSTLESVQTHLTGAPGEDDGSKLDHDAGGCAGGVGNAYSSFSFMVGVVCVSFFVAVLMALAMVSVSTWCSKSKEDPNREHTVPLNHTRFRNSRHRRSLDLDENTNVII